MDLYSRKIIAWVLSQSLEAIHVVECVNKAAADADAKCHLAACVS